MGYKADQRMFEYYVKLRVYCPNCGHSNTIPIQRDKKICSWCGKIVYRNEQIEFKEKLKEAQRKEKRI